MYICHNAFDFTNEFLTKIDGSGYSICGSDAGLSVAMICMIFTKT